MSNISYLPTGGLSYDPTEEVYWDKDALNGELERAFEVCHGCRMCFKYCDSFRTLFDLLDDEEHDGDVRKITAAETNTVLDACFQCKLCEVECPYTPRKDHEFQLDFPKLVHRHQAHRRKTERPSWGQRMMADPDSSSRLARASLGIVNTMNRLRIHRVFQEKLLGIHRDKLLPEFASQTFTAQAKAQGRTSPPRDCEAVLFATCYVENNEPQVGMDTLDVLDKNQVDVACPKGTRCCGMPAWEQGDLDALRAQARANLDALMPFVERGAKVLVINPTCSMMLRQDYPELLEGGDRERAKKLSAAVADVGEYLWSIRKEERFNTDFASRPAEDTIAYHTPCHLRAQQVGFKGRDLLRMIPGVQPTTVMECCGHDGTYAMTTEGFEPSQRIGKKAFDGMKEAGSELWVTDCPLAALQFQQHAERRALHPMTVLARAYRKDGLDRPVASEEEEVPR